jgi:hypothetical protein
MANNLCAEVLVTTTGYVPGGGTIIHTYNKSTMAII